MADDNRDDATSAPSDDEGRDARQRQFSRREILRAGMAVPAVLALSPPAAAGGGGSHTAPGPRDPSEFRGHAPPAPPPHTHPQHKTSTRPPPPHPAPTPQ